MNISDFKLVRLSAQHIIKPFDCGDSDLNDFLRYDALNYQKELLAVTYLLESEERTIAFFSLLNDKITFEVDAKKNKPNWNKFNRSIPNQKRTFKGYPAIKIGRLAIDNHFKGLNVGTLILDYLKILFIDNNRTGCKFITLDAYKGSLAFYEKNDFKYLTNEDSLEETRLMYFDLSKML